MTRLTLRHTNLKYSLIGVLTWFARSHSICMRCPMHIRITEISLVVNLVSSAEFVASESVIVLSIERTACTFPFFRISPIASGLQANNQTKACLSRYAFTHLTNLTYRSPITPSSCHFNSTILSIVCPIESGFI